MSSAELYRAQDVMPIRSDAEYRLVLETIGTLTANVTDETQDRHLLALQQRTVLIGLLPKPPENYGETRLMDVS